MAVLLMIMLCLLIGVAVADERHWTDDGIAATSFAGGSGTQTDPYRISNGAELAFLANLVNTSVNETEYYCCLISDIDLSQHIWTPIGLYMPGKYTSFRGTFDGCGKAISGMQIICDQPYYCVGLFGMVGTRDGGATIKNVFLQGEIRSEGINVHSGVCVGGLLGDTDNATLVENCHVKVAINLINNQADALYAGGIAGHFPSGSMCDSSTQCNIHIHNQSGEEILVGGLTEFALSTGRSNQIHKNNSAVGCIVIENENPAAQCEAGGLFAIYQGDTKGLNGNQYADMDIQIIGKGHRLAAALAANCYEGIVLEEAYWNRDARIEAPIGMSIPIGYTEEALSPSLHSFWGNGKSWIIEDLNLPLKQQLNQWVTSNTDQQYRTWRSATSIDENQGLPVHGTETEAHLPPHTGDTARPFAWTLLMGITISALMLLRKQRKTKG